MDKLMGFCKVLMYTCTPFLVANVLIRSYSGLSIGFSTIISIMFLCVVVGINIGMDIMMYLLGDERN